VLIGIQSYSASSREGFTIISQEGTLMVDDPHRMVMVEMVDGVEMMVSLRELVLCL